MTEGLKHKRIMLVEDDQRLALLISEYLQGEGFDVQNIGDGTLAIREIVQQQPDLVILDIMLPGTDGVEVCRKVRQSFDKPIIMLTAAANDFAEIASLNHGADSYLNKPIKPQVLLAHIQAILRREQANTNETTRMQVQDIIAESDSLRVTVSGERVEFTSAEFDLLWLLMENEGLAMSRDALYQNTRGIDYDGVDRSLDLRVSQLRKKLKDEEAPYRYIKTVRNKGYLFSSH